MSSVNKAVLIGRLGADPELRYTKTGKAVANFSLATQRDRDAETHWHKIVAWAERAEFVAQYLSKGRQVYVEGEITYRKYEDRDGNNRISTEIVAWNVQPLDAKPDSERGAKNGRAPAGAHNGPPGFDHDTDIPF